MELLDIENIIVKNTNCNNEIKNLQKQRRNKDMKIQREVKDRIRCLYTDNRCIQIIEMPVYR